MPDYTQSEHSDSVTDPIPAAIVDAISKGTIATKRELLETLRRFDMEQVPSDITILVTTIAKDGAENSWRSSWHGLKQGDDDHPTELDQVAEIYRHLQVAAKRLGLRLDLRTAGEQIRRARRRTPGRRRGPQDHRGH